MTTRPLEPGDCAGQVPTDDAHVAEPVDREARRRIRETLDRTLFANAGAGSGKTSHLVERVCELVIRGRARVDQLAVITFSEAAAAELRDRVAEALETAARTSDDASAVQRACEALTALDGAAISTLHGFARRILAAHPFEAGLPATFEVLDEAGSLADLDEQWHGVVCALLDDAETARAMQWLIASGEDVYKLRPILRQLGQNWDLVASPGAVVGGRDRLLPHLDLGRVVVPLAAALELAPHCTEIDDGLLRHLGSLGEVVDELREAAGDEPGVLRSLSAPTSYGAGNKGRAGAWCGRKPEVQALLGEAQRAREEIVAHALDAALRQLASALSDLTLESARRRRHDGRLQYHDLLVLAAELVRDHPDVRRSLHEEFRAILVDEFQDTDPLQAELVCMIAARPTAEVGRVGWWQLPIVPGALFFVGDPMQSIYAFRRADIATFLLVRAQVAQGSESLVSNFRSLPGIVEWVNSIFALLVGTGASTLQAPHEPAVPARLDSAASGNAARAATLGGLASLLPACPVTVLGADVEHAPSAEVARVREAQELAALLACAVAQGWPIGRGGRPVQPDDITVLVPSRRSLPALESALDAAALPYRLESSSLVYDAPEVVDLLHVLRAIDDPSDEVAVVAALRTPGFGCGDDDLVRFRLSGGSWDYRALEPPDSAGEDPVGCGLAALSRLHDVRSWTGVSELVARVVQERRQLAASLDDRRWREEWRRLRFVQDQARQFAESSSGGLREYLAWVDVQRDDDARVTEVVLPEADAPAVAVMTVHSAKGLEFPVVGVIGLGSTPQGVRCPAVLFGPDGLEIGLKSARATAGFADSRKREDLVLAEERLRLLYVAVTRAQNHLIVSVHRGVRATQSTAARLEAPLRAVRGLWSAPPSQDGRHRQLVQVQVGRPVTAHDLADRAEPHDPADTPDELDRWARERAAALLAHPRRVVAATSVVSLAAEGVGGVRSTVAPGGGYASQASQASQASHASHASHADADADATTVDTATPSALWRRGRGGTAVGRAVHAVLQTIDLETGEGLNAMAVAHGTREGVPERADEIATLARVALESEIVRQAVSGRYWRELYVGVPVGSRVLEGFVDLVYEGTDGLEVVDYKTDRLDGDAHIAELVERYRLQAAAYACAVRAVTGREVVRCTLLFLRGDGAVAGNVPDLQEATEEVTLLLRGDPPAELVEV